MREEEEEREGRESVGDGEERESLALVAEGRRREAAPLREAIEADERERRSAIRSFPLVLKSAT